MILEMLFWIGFGALAGWIAALIAGTQTERDVGKSIAMGTVGALAGGLIWRVLTGSRLSDIDLIGLLLAVVGCIVLVYAVHVHGQHNQA